MSAVASLPFVDQAIWAASPVAIGVSGGKDSQAAALATFQYLDELGHEGPRVLVHADLGVVEWKDSLLVCEELAAHLGRELLVVRRKAGDLMDRWEARWRSSVDRYAALETVTLVPCWYTRMLTDAEADILAGVRAEVSALFDIECACLDRGSIHERYAELMRQREEA